MSDAHISCRPRATHRQSLLLCHRSQDVEDRLQHIGDGEGDRLLIHQRGAAAREFDHVARQRTQPEGGTVDQPQLALLDRRQLTTRTGPQAFGEDQDGAQRRAHVVRHLHDELLRIVARQPRRKPMRGVDVEFLLHPFKSAQHAHDFFRLGTHIGRLRLHQEGTTQTLEQPASRHVRWKAGQVALLVGDRAPQRLEHDGQGSAHIHRRRRHVLGRLPRSRDLGSGGRQGAPRGAPDARLHRGRWRHRSLTP